MIVAKYPSLETKWLHKCAPWMPQPEVVFSKLEDYAGMYYRPQHGVHLSNGIDRSNGIIVVDPYRHPDSDSVLAHEWRHHYQYFHGPHDDGLSWEYLSDNYSYEEAVVKYFTLSHTEMDAFIFSSTHCNFDEFDERWLELIVKDMEK